jgi:hypothetical protein
MKYVEVSITATIPADNEEVGYEAVVKAKDHVNAIVDALDGLGLTDITRVLHIAKKHGKRATQASD